MAIVKIKKFHLLSLDSQKDELLRRLQIFRDVQFENDVEDEDIFKKLEGFDTEDAQLANDGCISKCAYAIDLIEKYRSEISPVKALIQGLPNYTFDEMEKRAQAFDLDGSSEKVRKAGYGLYGAESKISKLREEINELYPLRDMDVSFADLKRVKSYKAIVAGVAYKLEADLNTLLDSIDGIYYEKVSQGKDESVYMIIYGEEHAEQIENASRATNLNVYELDYDTTPAQRVQNLKNEIEQLEEEKKAYIDEIKGYESMLEDFQVSYEYYSNLKLREQAKEDFLKTDKVCIITGYFPAEEEATLEGIVNDVTGGCYHIEYEEVDRDSEDVPIILKNNRLVKAFESVTATYALPKYNEVDPTPLYAPFYALFFGMMSADVGYGLSLLIITTLALKLCNLKPSMRQFVRFFQIIGVSTTIWGFLYGGYFGATIPGMWRLLDLSTQFMTVLIVSIIIGAINLFYGLAIKAYLLIREKNYADAFFEVFAWYICLGGIIAFLLGLAGLLNPQATQIAKWVMIVGLVLVFIAGTRQVSKGSNVGVKGAVGLYNVYGISSYIGDFVSYSRLMALGMSGGYIAFAVNMIASMLFAKGIFGIVFGILILVFFHAFNLFLSCLGAYVHSLRLVYVEFFGKFYEGGGKAFKFFRKAPKYINLDRHLED